MSIRAINDNNPPGSHPVLVTRLIIDGKHFKLDRAKTEQLRAELSHILDMNSSESLSAYRKRMDEAYR